MDIVTNIETERKLYKLTFNDRETLYLTPRQYRERGLAAGDETDLSELKDWLLNRQYPYALDRAVAFLAQRPRSRGEIEAMLKRLRVSEETIDMVCYKLEKERFLNDEAFASDWAQARSHRQIGESRIRRELKQKGVDDSLISAACEGLDEDEAREGALALAKKLVKRYRADEPRKAMEKAVAAMARRGYGYGAAAEAIRAALREQEDE